MGIYLPPIMSLSSKHINILPNDAYTQTINGITYTVNPDGSITTSGTSTDRSYIAVHWDHDLSEYRGKSLILNGCPSGGNHTNGYYSLLALYDGSDPSITPAPETDFYDEGSGVTINIPSTEPTTSIVCVWIVYETAGITANETFYPMIRDADDPDDTYVPYTKSNRELTVLSDISSNKNLIPFPYRQLQARKSADNKWTENGITFIVKYDGSISVVGTATADTYFNLFNHEQGIQFENGDYILSAKGLISGGNCVVWVNKWTNGSFDTTIAHVQQPNIDYKFTIDFNRDNLSYLDMGITVYSGQTINTTIYPMIRKADDEDPTWSSPALQNGEVNVSKVPVQMIAYPEKTRRTSKAHTIGDVFIFNGTLYRATANISEFGAIQDGVNCEQIQPLANQLTDEYHIDISSYLSIYGTVGNDIIISGGSAQLVILGVFNQALSALTTYRLNPNNPLPKSIARGYWKYGFMICTAESNGAGGSKCPQCYGTITLNPEGYLDLFVSGPNGVKANDTYVVIVMDLGNIIH